ncbi:MAG: OmpA family protein [Hyphomicrobiaceae bacterium]
MTARFSPAKKGRAAFAALLSCLAGLGASQALADCASVDQAIRSAIGTGDVAAFGTLNRQMLSEPTCPGDYRERAGRVLALASLRHLETVNGTAKGVLPLDEIREAARYGRPWQVMMALGDSQYEAGDFGEAVSAYEAAIDDIRDERLNPKAPGAVYEERLFKRAYQARALAVAYVPTPMRNGRPGGLASPQFRSFTVEAVPVPVRFEYRESRLTPDGEAAAADILRYLKAEGIGHVRIIGHTDPVGSDTYNLALSQKRAEAVRDYLVGYGYEGKVDVVGMGEMRLFEPDDPSRYSEDQRHAFDRRVEYEVMR